jgi:uncharacterized membrane protein YdbT with pleckstrin-like domain
MFETIKAWFIRRAIHKQINKIGDTEAQLDSALKAASSELTQAAREARKRNKLIEARRLINDVNDPQDEADDNDDEWSDPEGDYEEELERKNGFNAEKMLMDLLGNAVKSKLGVASPTVQAATQTAPAESLIKDVAHRQINALSDAELIEIARYLKK